MATETELYNQSRLQQQRVSVQYAEDLEPHNPGQLAAQAEQEAQKQPPRMGFGFFMILFLVCAIFDSVDFITGGTIGTVIGLFGDLIIWATMGTSPSTKKQTKKMLVSFIGEAIPIISILPLRTLMLLYAYASANPTIANKLQGIAKTVQYLGPQTPNRFTSLNTLRATGNLERFRDKSPR